ncbi:MAG: hypothetical protein VR72_15625 [Clostridiaceae bacterium BRH_c20a]|nr:MAG: hypothetical protein VR72_15625 [Clostridiaceae bacterium BRH_c20a]
MKKASVFLSVVLILSLLLTACGGGAAPKQEAPKETPKEEAKAAPIILKFAHSQNDKHKYHLAHVKFKELIEQKSDGRYKIEIFAQSLGADRDLIEGLQLGTVDAASINTSVIASIAPELGAIDLPFLFKDRAHAYRVLDGEIGQELSDLIKNKARIIPAGFWENGFRDFTNNKRPIKTPEDLKDLKMRVMEVAIYLDTFKQWGANATPMAWPEVYPAMQQGVIDGHDNAADTVNANKLWEVQKHFSDSQHLYSAVVLGLSPNFYNKLNDADKKMFMEVSAEVTKYEREIAAKMYDEGLINLRKNMTVTEKDEIDFEAFKASVQPVWEKYYDVFGKDLIQKIANS